MLYLAELSKPIVGNPSLHLLARTQQQDSWQPVDETIPIDGRQAREFKDGGLLLVDIGGNRQINRITEAAKQVVTYLQNFSRAQEKAKEQEGEIEEWKQSLSFQSAELQRRLSELDSQEEEVRQLYEKYQQAQDETRILEAKREELASLEAHLSEQQRLVGQQRETLRQQQEELAAQLQEGQKSRLGEAEAAQLHSLINQVASDLGSLADPHQHLQAIQDRIQHDQAHLDQAQGQLDQEYQEAEQAQADLDQAIRAWEQRRQDWLSAQETLAQLRAEVQAQTALVSQYHQHLQGLIQSFNISEQAYHCAEQLLQQHDVLVADQGLGSAAPAEPAISLPDLEAQVEQKRRLYEQRAGQVNQQVAELEQSQQTITELEARYQAASADDKFDLEMDLDYARESFKLLQETILPQQDSLQREYEELMRQEAKLAQLKGDPAAPVLPKVDIGPLMALIQQQRSTQHSHKSTLESEAQRIQSALHQAQEQLTQQMQAHQHQEQLIFEQERSLKVQIQGMAERWGGLHERRHQLEQQRSRLQELRGILHQVAESLQPMNELLASSQTHVASMMGLLATLTEDALLAS